MRTLVIDELKNDEGFFHFDARSIEFIETNGFPADIGPDSKNAETNPKVFFSTGIKGILEIMDVWLIWRMNKDHNMSPGWQKEFLSEQYLEDEEKKNKTFSNMYDWLRERRYFKLSLTEGEDYIDGDIDEAKQSAIEDRINCAKRNMASWKYDFLKQMYKGKIRHNNEKVEDWNLHTIVNVGVQPEKITQLVTPTGETDVLSIVEYLYKNYENKAEFRLLNDFMHFVQEKRMAQPAKKVKIYSTN